MFDLYRFIADCIEAQTADPSSKLVQQVVARAVSECAGVLHGLGEPRRAQMQKLYHSPRLTILNIIWAPGMTMVPHDHRMWAVIGLYTGREDNTFWRRIKGDLHGRVEPTAVRSLAAGEAKSLATNVIHSVANPLPRLTGALHVYGGDFFAAHRSEWNPDTMREERFDADKAVCRFEEWVSPQAG